MGRMTVGRARDRSIEHVRELLESAGFFVSDAHHIRPTSFDLMARRDSLLLILKVLKNIDALDPSEAERLRALAGLFNGSVLLVGEVSGANRLGAGVLYNRYGIPIVVEESLRDYLAHGIPPFLFSSPGGIFARIDGERLRALRESRSLSLGALAGIAGVSRRTIQLYEEGGGAEVAVVDRIERFLGEPVAMPIEILPMPGPPPRPMPEDDDEEEDDEEGDDDLPRPGPRRPRGPIPTGDPLRDTVVQRLGDMGWRVVVTVRCPFDAFSQGRASGGEEILLTGVGTMRSAQHRADLLQEIARVAEGHALYVVRELSNRRSIGGLPILSMGELRRHRDRDELLEEIAEREGA
jgi:putative transcriptional regulator